MKNRLLLLVLLASCGAPVQEQAPAPQPLPRPLPDEGGGELTFSGDIQPLLKTYCAQCHSDATFISSETAFLASKSPVRIANKSMPQRGSKNYASWGDEQRELIAEFVAANQ